MISPEQKNTKNFEIVYEMHSHIKAVTKEKEKNSCQQV